MKISIITVCFNAAKTIEKTLESIQSQTYKNIETIIIDGGSNDGTVEIIKKYSPSYFVSEKDNGIYNAMNKGIKASSGDIIYFLNADDTLYNENVLSNVVKEFNCGNFEVIWGDIVAVDCNGNENYVKCNKLNKSTYLLNTSLCHQAIFYKKSLFDELGFFDEKYKLLADHEFNLRVFCIKKAKFKYINKIICRFNTEGVSSSENQKLKLKKETQDIISKYCKSKFMLKVRLIGQVFVRKPLFLFSAKHLRLLKESFENF